MKKRIILIILSIACIICSALALTACGNSVPDDSSSDKEDYKPHVHSYIPTVTAPNCTNAGFTTYTCACGSSYKDNYVNATGHAPKAAVRENEVSATCTKAGGYDEIVRCSVCNDLISSTHKTVEKLTHTYSNGVCKSCGVAIETLANLTSENYTIDTSTPIATFKRTVSNATENIDLVNAFSFDIPCTWKLYSDFTGTNEYGLKAMTLNTGHNEAYIIVSYEQCPEYFTRYKLDIYRLHSFTYSFVANGEIIESGAKEETTALTAPVNTAFAGYEFNGWELNGETASLPVTVMQDLTFTAKLTPITYGITYELDGGALEAQNPANYNIETETVTLNNPVKSYYTFMGWFTSDEQPVTEIVKGTYGDITLKAKWQYGSEGLIYTLNNDAYTVSGYNGTATSIAVPETWNNLPVTAIERGVFRKCASLESITLPFTGNTLNGYDNTHLGYIFGADSYSDNANYVPSSLKTVKITGGTSFGRGAFAYCSNLTNIIIPDSVTSIGVDAFYSCSGLTSITIGNGVTSIVGPAFSGCSVLTSVYYTGDIASWCKINGLGSLMCCSSNRKLYINGAEITGELIIPDSIASIGDSAFEGCSGLTNVTIPDSIASIGDSAFEGCSGLTNVTIPDSIDSIGSSAFSGCDGLTNVTIPDSVKSIGDSAFRDCSKLTNITIPDGVTSIGNSTFRGCGNLTSITIPDGVASIGDSAFEGCVKLTNVTIPDKVTSIGSKAFNNCRKLTSIVIPNGVKSISVGMFSGCSSLESITLPFVGASAKTPSDTYQVPFGFIFGTNSYDDSVRTMQHYYGSSTSSSIYGEYYIPATLKKVTITGGNILYGAFECCNMLTSITLPDGITSIGRSAFEGCYGLTSIILPDSVTSIDRNAFKFCSGLTEVTLPDGVTSIYSNAFYECYRLTNITIPDSVTFIGTDAFTGCTQLQYNVYDNANYLGNTNNPYLTLIKATSTKITSCTINDRTRFIYNSAFEDCNNFISITIPDSVTSIGNAAFRNCDLTSITIPDSVKDISGYTFEGCRILASITLPDSVTYIGYSAFKDCSMLTSVYYKGTAEDWQKIDIGDYQNSYLINAERYYYSENEPALNADGTAYDGNYWRYNTDGEIVVWIKEN